MRCGSTGQWAHMAQLDIQIAVCQWLLHIRSVPVARELVLCVLRLWQVIFGLDKHSERWILMLTLNLDILRRSWLFQIIRSLFFFFGQIKGMLYGFPFYVKTIFHAVDINAHSDLRYIYSWWWFVRRSLHIARPQVLPQHVLCTMCDTILSRLWFFNVG